MTGAHGLSVLIPLLRGLAPVALALGVCMLCERLRPAEREAPRSLGLNLGAGLFSTVVQSLLSGSLGVLATLAVNACGGGVITLPSHGWGLLAGAAVYLVAMDLGEYLFHRAQHLIPAMWAMHSLHHSDRTLSTTSALRHFWVEPLIKTFTIWLAVGLAFKAGPAVVSIYAFASLYHFWTHANVDVDYGWASWALNSPRYHRQHHSVAPEDHNANFASLLPIFDLISGAYRKPRLAAAVATGLEDEPDSLTQALVWPLRDRRAPRETASATRSTI